MATATAEQMRAERIHSFGGPEVLRFESVPKPKPKENEILVHVHAASVNPVDWKIREGHLGQFPLPMIMGSDFSGVVAEIGPRVEEFRVGQAVFGTVADESGSYAEFAIAPVLQAAEKPPKLPHTQAAALPTAGLTAWQALYEHGGLRERQKILIHAAAGGVGAFAVQFAKLKGARVIGTASREHRDFVRELGADEVIDYRATKFEQVVRDVDVVFDTIGGETQQRSWGVLKKGGILVSVVQPPSEEAPRKYGVTGEFFRCDLARSDELAQIAELVSTGRVQVNIQSVLPLEKAREAQELSQKGHSQGKIVLRIVK